jgi:DNA repair exonuclease SbcCD ATPase subunit
MKEKLLSPKEHEIKLSFHNYKLLKKKDFNLKGSCIYFVKGPNGVGKTTILNGLKAAQEIKDDTPEKLTRGQVEGRNEFMIPGPDGKNYMVAYEFTESKVKFIVIDEDGNKIDRITDMRDIFGYQHISAREFITWSRTAEGRRKQKQFILDLLSPEAFITYSEYEEEETKRFEQRRELNRELDKINSIMKEFAVTKEERELFEKEDKARSLLEKYKKELSEIEVDESKISNLRYKLSDLNSKMGNIEYKAQNERTINTSAIESNEDDIMEWKEEISRLQDKILKAEDLNKQLKLKNEEIETEMRKNVDPLIDKRNEINKRLDDIISSDDTEKIGKLKESIQHGEEFMNRLNKVYDKHEKFLEYEKEQKELIEKTEKLSDIIDDMRKSKDDIIKGGNFPVELLSFDENGYLTIDGFRFDENQVCESDAILLVSEILCKTNKSIIQIVGDASVLDFKKLDRLNQIAEQNGKVMFVDEVDREISNLVIVGYEDIREEKASGKKTKNPDEKDDVSDKKEEEEDLF